MSLKVEGVPKLIARLRARSSYYGSKPQVAAVVGYSAPYALMVHERLDVQHNNGQAKFLEQPALMYRDMLAMQIERDLRQGKEMQQAVLGAAETLKLLSQDLVPVDTGTLRDSAFARVES